MRKMGFQADGEGPIRKVKVDPFYIDYYTVTNEEFKHFIDEPDMSRKRNNLVGHLSFIILLVKKQQKK